MCKIHHLRHLNNIEFSKLSSFQWHTNFGLTFYTCNMFLEQKKMKENLCSFFRKVSLNFRYHNIDILFLPISQKYHYSRHLSKIIKYGFRLVVSYLKIFLTSSSFKKNMYKKRKHFYDQLPYQQLSYF